MEDYIFIILAVVLAIVGAINKKKRQQNTANKEEQTPRNFLMDQLLGDDFLEEEPFMPITEPASEITMTNKSPQDSARTVDEKKVKTFNDLKKQEQKKDLLKSSVSVTMKDANEEETTTFHESLKDDFSLRKAVIYSTILEKKY